MPYIKKSELKKMLMDAFGVGFWRGIDIEHEKDSLHMKQHSDFEKYYEALQAKSTKDKATK